MDDELHIEERGGRRLVRLGDRERETHYSARALRALEARKGAKRAFEMLGHKEKRARFFAPLFEYLEKQGRRELRVLEVGCAFGHLTECLEEQAAIGEIRAYEVDGAMAEIARMNIADLGLRKVASLEHLTIRETRNLPYESGYFDLVIVSAVVEHLPFEDRHVYVDEYYRVAKEGGLVCFFDTPNRLWPFEGHSTRMPFIQLMPPAAAYLYGRLFGALRGTSFPAFVRAGTGWRNSSYYELLPKSMMLQVRDVSEEAGYPQVLPFRKLTLKNLVRYGVYLPLKAVQKICGAPAGMFLPSLDVVFLVEKDFERN